MRSAIVSCALIAGVVVAQQLTDDTVAKVKANLATAAKQSWELGTRAQALLELDNSPLSVFTPGSIPPPFSKANTTALQDVLSIAQNAVSKLNKDNTPRPLDAGAGGDPPSMGIAVLLANASGGANATDYAQAAQNQLAFVLDKLPRSSDGAISHRAEQVQLWADFIYMTPPFIAYYGAITNNKTLIDTAYTQCSLYRDHLRDKKNSVWMHMALGSGYNDAGLWATGNGWAAAGMLRVLATMAQSSFAGDFKGEMSDLEHWVTEILDGMYSKLDKSSLLFPNYINQDGAFDDGSSTALIAAATYRLSLLRSVHHHLPDAERVRKGLVARVDSDGWLAPVVDPESFAKQGTHSPEGQAFILLMHSAWRDWVADGSQGANGGPAIVVPPPKGVVAVLALGQIAWLVGRRVGLPVAR
ncbi:glycoside hydrolase family 105 protein [Exidia glandulosa HHB12029]|uniref:Glycoside hydrolase family 105 protein n=1 Tax=Exidia glandulosa HHB12029 TaxID=1314781 RepID=A0A165PPM4_EXIGL|nr:glycoside hydrolase family 105 protein [Exidia glandulosa HHB12029]